VPEVRAVPTTESDLTFLAGQVTLLSRRVEELLARIDQQDREIVKLRAAMKPSERRAQERDMRLFDLKVVARILKVDPETIRRWRKAGLIGHVVYPGGDVRFSGQHIREFIESMEKPRAAEYKPRLLSYTTSKRIA
jgi:helix-turn-helix protein